MSITENNPVVAPESEEIDRLTGEIKRIEELLATNTCGVHAWASDLEGDYTAFWRQVKRERARLQVELEELKTRLQELRA